MTLPDDTEPSTEALAVARDFLGNQPQALVIALALALDRFRAAEVEAERERIAHDIATDWADYEDDEP